jgi:hypothetical protein
MGEERSAMAELSEQYKQNKELQTDTERRERQRWSYRQRQRGERQGWSGLELWRVGFYRVKSRDVISAKACPEPSRRAGIQQQASGRA